MRGGFELVVQGVELVHVGMVQVDLGLQSTASLSFSSIELSSGTFKEFSSDSLLLLSGCTNKLKVGSIMLKIALDLCVG